MTSTLATNQLCLEGFVEFTPVIRSRWNESDVTNPIVRNNFKNVWAELLGCTGLFTLNLRVRKLAQLVATRQIICDDSSFQVPPLMISGYFGEGVKWPPNVERQTRKLFLHKKHLTWNLMVFTKTLRTTEKKQKANKNRKSWKWPWDWQEQKTGTLVGLMQKGRRSSTFTEISPDLLGWAKQLISK